MEGIKMNTEKEIDKNLRKNELISNNINYNEEIILLIEKRETIIFHYNKHHNVDTSTPPWIIKCKGITYYINHMDIFPGIGFSTNETPDNPNTKGTMKIKGKIKIFKNESNNIIAEIF